MLPTLVRPLKPETMVVMLDAVFRGRKRKSGIFPSCSAAKYGRSAKSRVLNKVYRLPFLRLIHTLLGLQGNYRPIHRRGIDGFSRMAIEDPLKF